MPCSVARRRRWRRRRRRLVALSFGSGTAYMNTPHPHSLHSLSLSLSLVRPARVSSHLSLPVEFVVVRSLLRSMLLRLSSSDVRAYDYTRLTRVYVYVHANSAHTCTACIYRESRDEREREKHTRVLVRIAMCTRIIYLRPRAV